MRLATLTKTQQSSPFAQAEQKQLWRLSAVVVLSTPLFAMTADYNDVYQLHSSAARLTSLLRYRLTVHGTHGNCRWLKPRLETVLVGLVSLATQPSLFFSCPSPPTSLCTANTTPGQIRYYSDRFSIVANRSCVLRSKYFACIFNGLCAPVSVSTQPWPGWQRNVYCGRWLGVFKEFLKAHAHLLVSVWQDLKGDQNMICDKFRPLQQRSHPSYVCNVYTPHPPIITP